MGCGASSLQNGKHPKDSIVLPHPLVQETISPLLKVKAIEAIKKNDNFLVQKVLLQVDPVENLGLPGENYTCLHAAAQHNSFMSMEIFLEWLKLNRETDLLTILEIPNSEGHNPTTLSIINNSSETFYVLINSNLVNLQYKNKLGQSLADICRQYSPDCLELLEKLETKATQPDEQHDTKKPENQPDQHNRGHGRGRGGRKCHGKIDTVARRVKRVKRLSTEQEIVRNIMVDTEAAFQGIPPTTKVYKLLSQFAASGKHFVDHDFKANVTSITSNVNHEQYQHFKNSVWKRPDQLFQCKFEDIFLFDTIDPQDIEQGLLGVCYLLSSLSALAEFPSRLTQIFINQTCNKFGVYGMKVYLKGIPTEIIVDDYIPCFGDKDLPLFSKPKGKELWVLLAEKAWAKIYHNYTACELGFMDEALEYLLGTPAFRYHTNDHEEQELFEILSEADKNKFVLCAGTRSDVTNEIGLVADHAYSIISAHEINNYKIFVLRNPWAKFEWNGDFSDNSPLWTDELKTKVGYSNADDGQFCMTVQDFKKYFEFYTISMYYDGWDYNYVEVESDPNHAEYFKIMIDHPCDIYLRIHQKDMRLFSEKEQQTHKYSSADIVLAKLEEDGTYRTLLPGPEMAHNGAYHGARSIYPSKKCKLEVSEPGEYILRTKMRWRHGKKDKFTLSAYAPFDIEFNKIPPIKQFLYSFFKNIGKKAEKKDVGNDCFLSYAFYLHYLYIYLENQSTSTWVVDIEFTKLQNLKLGKAFRTSDNTFHVEILPGQSQVALVKKIDVAGTTSYGWKFEHQLI